MREAPAVKLALAPPACPTYALWRRTPIMDLADVRKNAPFLAVIMAIALTGLALIVATISLLVRM